jgi:predicted acetyltransferase
MIIKIVILLIVLLAVCASILYVYASTNNLYYRIGTFVLGIALLYLTYTHTTSEQFINTSDIIVRRKHQNEGKTKKTKK